MPDYSYNLSLELSNETYIIAGAAFLIGILLTWLICRSSKKAAIAKLSATLEAEENRADETKQRLASTQKDLQILRDSESELKQNEARLIAKLTSEQKQAKEKEIILNKAQAKLDERIKSSQDQLLKIAKTTQQDTTKELEQRNNAVEQMFKSVTNTLHKVEYRIGSLEKTRANSHSILQQQATQIADAQLETQQQVAKLTAALSKPTTSSLLSEITRSPQQNSPLSIPSESTQPIETIIEDEDTSDFTDTLADEFEGFTAETPGDGI